MLEVFLGIVAVIFIIILIGFAAFGFWLAYFIVKTFRLEWEKKQDERRNLRR